MKRRFSLTAQLTGMIELLMVGFSAVVLALFLMSARSLLLRHFESSLQRDAYVIAKELASASTGRRRRRCTRACRAAAHFPR